MVLPDALPLPSALQIWWPWLSILAAASALLLALILTVVVPLLQYTLQEYVSAWAALAKAMAPKAKAARRRVKVLKDVIGKLRGSKVLKIKTTGLTHTASQRPSALSYCHKYQKILNHYAARDNERLDPQMPVTLKCPPYYLERPSR